MWIFAEKVILPAAVAILVLLATNPMKFDNFQRFYAGVAVVAAALFVGQTLQKRTEQQGLVEKPSTQHQSDEPPSSPPEAGEGRTDRPGRPKEVPDQSPILYACVADGSQGSMLARIDLSNGTVTEAGIKFNRISVRGLAYDSDQKMLYGVGGPSGGANVFSYLYRINLKGNSFEIVDELPSDSPIERATYWGLAYDSAERVLYASSQLRLVTAPPKTAVKLSFELEKHVVTRSLAFDPSTFTLFMVTAGSSMRGLNAMKTSEGAMRYIGDFAQQSESVGQILAIQYDATNNRLIGIAGGTTDYIVQIDRETGRAERLVALHPNYQYRSLVFVPRG